MLCSIILFESEFLNIVSISFTALVLNELIMVAVEITTWHMLMVVSEVFTLGLYLLSIAFLPEYFGASSPPPLPSPPPPLSSLLPRFSEVHPLTRSHLPPHSQISPSSSPRPSPGKSP